MPHAWTKIKRLWVAFPILVAGVFVTTHFLASAATGRIYLSPASSSVQNGSNITLEVRIDPGVPVGGVEDVTVTFDESKLQLVSGPSFAGSPFDVELAAPSVTAGSVKVSRATFGAAASSDSLIMKLTFKGLVGTGSTTLQVSGQAGGESGYTDPAGASAAVNFTSPPSGGGGSPPPAPPSSPTPPPSSGGGGSPPPAPPSSNGGGGTDKTGDSSDDKSGDSGITIEAGNIEFTKAAILVKGNVPIKALVKYGMNGDLPFETSQTGFGVNHEIHLDEAHLIAGTNYDYIVVTEDEGGTVQESDPMSFRTKGYTIKVKIVDRDSRPLKGKQVTLYSDPLTAKTDRNGVAIFNDVPPGEHTLEYDEGGKKYSKKITVDDAKITDESGFQIADAQNVAVVFEDLETGSFSVAPIIVATVVVLAVIGGLLVLRMMKQTKGLAPASSSSGIVQGNIGGPMPAPSPSVQPEATINPDIRPVEARPVPSEPVATRPAAVSATPPPITPSPQSPAPAASPTSVGDSIAPGTVIRPTEQRQEDAGQGV